MSAFDKIIGYEKEVKDLRMLCDAMCHKEKYEAIGVCLPQTLLLFGEPGTGKTLMANALITESGRTCFSCRKDRSDGEFVDRITEVFRQAVDAEPSIIFFDDMDKFAEDNLQENSNKEEFITIQTGLEDIRGKDVFVIATANSLRNLPESLMRAGRFGRRIHVGVPAYQDAVKIIRNVLSDKKMDADIQAEEIAHLLSGQSCAALEAVINEAGVLAAYENREKIARTDMVKAFLRIKFGGLVEEAKEGNTDLRLKKAYHEAGHAVMALTMHHRVDLVTICDFGEIGGFCLEDNIKEMYTYRQVREEIAILLAGHVAVQICFGETDLGSTDDIIRSMELQNGMLETCGVSNYRYGYWYRHYQEKQAPRALDRGVRKVQVLMARYEQKVRAILRRNRKLLVAIAEALMQKELLLKEDIDRICREIA